MFKMKGWLLFILFVKIQNRVVVVKLLGELLRLRFKMALIIDFVMLKKDNFR